MKEYTITIPRRRDLRASLSWASSLFSSPRADKYYIDFKDMEWIEPFTLLFLSSNIQRFEAMNSESEFLPKNFQQHTYAAHMGFFKALQIDFGNNPGAAQGSSNYLPITIFSIRELQKKADHKAMPTGQLLEDHATELARLLTQEARSNLVDTLTYALREIMRNAVEHSESDNFLYCGQYWSKRNTVQVAILDNGVGVRNALSNNPNLRIISDDHALRLSILPGITGKLHRSKIEDYDDWDNTGYGLYLTKRLCTKGGSFFLCSGNKGLYSKAAENDKYLNTSFKGTALRMILDKNSISSLKTALKQFRVEGEEMAKKFRDGVPKASASSRGIIGR